ncbi:MAG: TonB C-terminal domain-containing protein [Burkholderiaceae bacterium]|nr:TonB C-terminal domain-containing protein [Burkholderiaceae bacterium]
METAITARVRGLFDRYRTRLAIGVLFSLVIHGFILSLRLGIPGLGLPGLELPWNERRAQLPVLSVRLANLPSLPNQIPAPRPASTLPKPEPEQQQSVDHQPPSSLIDARTRQAPQRTALAAKQAAKALQATPALAKAERKKGAAPPDDQATAAPARSQAKLIALDSGKPSDFTMPAADQDDWWHSAPTPDSMPLPYPPTQAPTPPAIALRTSRPALDLAQAPAPAVQKPAPQESFERPDETQAKQQDSQTAPDLAMEQASKAEGEEILKQEAARLLEEQQAAQRAQDLQNKKQEEARKQAEEAARLLAAQKLEEEKAVKLAAELAAKKQEEIRQAELARAEAEHQAKELEARRQAEEATRRQLAALALQKQLEEEQKAEQRQAEVAKQAEQTRIKQQEALELARRQAEEEAKREALRLAELEQARLKAQAEEAARLQAAMAQAAMAQAEAKAKADAEAKLAAQAAAERESARLAAATRGDSNGNGVGNGTSNGLAANGSSLVANALAQVGKLGARPESGFGTAPSRADTSQARRSIFGSVDHDINLAMYKVGWRAKIERNGDLNYAQSAAEKKRADPVVTVAVRSDGSVEDIVINRSSGLAELDEAVRRIVLVNARYGMFPESLARKYDVIEIRAVWNFEEKLRLREELATE